MNKEWFRIEVIKENVKIEQGHRLADVKAVSEHGVGIVVLFYNGAIEMTESYDIDGWFQNVLS